MSALRSLRIFFAKDATHAIRSTILSLAKQAFRFELQRFRSWCG
jgi:hypothetical protein